MARKVTPAEYKRMVDKHNSDVKKYYANVNKQINDYNQKVKKHNSQVNKAISDYNSQVRKFNSSQSTRRQALKSASTKLNISNNIVIYSNSSIRTSTILLEGSYNLLENYTKTNRIAENSEILVDYPIQETSNSIQLYNSLTGIDGGDFIEPSSLQKTSVEQQLYSISEELGKRWQGAIFSLNPQNPDAARHFCTSIREIFIRLLDIKAPDHLVQTFPGCVLHEGKPNRRSKIRYMLSRKSILISPMENFLDSDIEDLLTLFRNLNDGTHGSAGTFGIQQLLKLKKRAEDSIIFIAEIGGYR